MAKSRKGEVGHKVRRLFFWIFLFLLIKVDMEGLVKQTNDLCSQYQTYQQDVANRLDGLKQALAAAKDNITTGRTRTIKRAMNNMLTRPMALLFA